MWCDSRIDQPQDARASGVDGEPTTRFTGAFELKIATFCHNYPPHPGGLEAIVAALSREQAAAGHNVQVTSTAWESKSGVSLEKSVRVVRLPAIHMLEQVGMPYPLPLHFGGMEATALPWRPDIVHAHGALYRTTALARRVAREYGSPLVVTEHVGWVPHRSALLNHLQRIAWRMYGYPTIKEASVVITYNDRVREWLANRAGRRDVRLITNGIDVSDFAPLDPEARSRARRKLGIPPLAVAGLFVGRAAAKKNLDALLAIERSTFTLVCCGTGRNYPADVIDLGLVPHEGMMAVYGAADFFVHLGVGEGFPVAVQEAAVSGLPIILLWEEGYRSSLARESVLAIDSLEELPAAIEKIAASGDLRRSLGARAREYALKSWRWRRTRDAHDRVYADALNRAGTTC